MPPRTNDSTRLIDIAPQISSVANVVPGLNLGASDPMSGLQQAVAARRNCAGRHNVGFADAGWQRHHDPMSVRATADWVLGFLGQVAVSPRQAVVSAVRSAWLPRSVGFTAVIEAGRRSGWCWVRYWDGSRLLQAGMGWRRGYWNLGGQAGGVIGGGAARAIEPASAVA